jgi:membrane protein implicated in regulation of membrane protease activity
MMLIYILCLVVGGTFVVLSAIGGLDGADFATDFDAEIDAETDSDFDDVDVGTHGNQASSSKRRRSFWLPFLSLRFWTFALCFFGLTGILVSLAQPNLVSGLVVLIAVAMGLLCGTAAAFVLRALGSNQVNSLTRPDELAGQIGTVEIPFDANSRGKVRLSIRGSTVGFFAFTQEQREFQQGESVLVVGLENNKLWVVSADALQLQDSDGGK